MAKRPGLPKDAIVTDQELGFRAGGKEIEVAVAIGVAEDGVGGRVIEWCKAPVR